MARIAKVEATSFKRLTHVELTIEAGDTVIRIAGGNANGKSSVLDAIAAALGGERLCPKDPIKHGETSAMARVTLDDGLVAERRWRRLKDGSTKPYLEVRAPDGQVLPSPQGVLDRLLGKLSFDPEDFARAEPKRQLELLRAATGINLSEYDTRRADLYAQRRDISRDLRGEESALLDLGSLPPAGEPVSVAALLEEQRAGLAAVEERRELERAAKSGREKAGQLALRVGELQRQILAMDAERARLTAAADAAEAELLMLPEPPDVGAVQARILAAQATNEECAARQRKLDERAKRMKIRDSLAAAFARLDGDIEAIDAEKVAILAEGKMPIPGLGFDEAGVTFQGILLEQASSAERMKVSIAMGIVLNPTLRIMLIRNASLFDSESLALVEEMAAAAGVQVWLELVGSVQGAIVIEDGEVAP